MRISKTTLHYVLAALVIAVVLALTWWYFYLKASEEAVTDVRDARGLSASLPRFSAETGSTYANITGESGSATSSSVARKNQVMWKITTTPVAGASFERDGLKLLYAERGTGYIFEVDTETSVTTRLTNRLEPKTYEALFADRSVLLRSLDEADTILTYAGTIAENAASTSALTMSKLATSTTKVPETLPGLYLPESIDEAAINARTHELLYLLQNTGGGVDAIRSSFNGGTRKTILSSRLSRWDVQYLTDGRMFLVTKGGDDIVGYAYELKSSGALVAIVRNTAGLTILPKSGSQAIAYSSSREGTLFLYAKTAPGAEEALLPVKTTAEKCVWDPSARELTLYCAVPLFLPSREFLNDWYRGAVHTTDAWWKMRVLSGEVELLYSTDENEPLDVENPVIDNGGTMIAFTNARNKTLWLFRIPGGTESGPNEAL